MLFLFLILTYYHSLLFYGNVKLFLYSYLIVDKINVLHLFHKIYTVKYRVRKLNFDPQKLHFLSIKPTFFAIETRIDIQQKMQQNGTIT